VVGLIDGGGRGVKTLQYGQGDGDDIFTGKSSGSMHAQESTDNCLRERVSIRYCLVPMLAAFVDAHEEFVPGKGKQPVAALGTYNQAGAEFGCLLGRKDGLTGCTASAPPYLVGVLLQPGVIDLG